MQPKADAFSRLINPVPDRTKPGDDVTNHPSMRRAHPIDKARSPLRSTTIASTPPWPGKPCVVLVFNPAKAERRRGRSRASSLDARARRGRFGLDGRFALERPDRCRARRRRKVCHAPCRARALSAFFSETAKSMGLVCHDLSHDM